MAEVLAKHDKRFRCDLWEYWQRVGYEKVNKYIKPRKEIKKSKEKLEEANIRRAFLDYHKHFPSKGRLMQFPHDVKYAPEEVQPSFSSLWEHSVEEKGLRIKKSIAGVDRNTNTLFRHPMLHDLGHTPFLHGLEPKTSLLQHLSPQYMLVDRCTKFVFAPITALTFVLSPIFYFYANIGMAVGFAGIGITSLLLTIVFSVTKSALKE